MEAYFKWNGTSSLTKNIIVEKYPSIVRPLTRVQKITVPGRAGTLTISEGVPDSMPISIDCFVQSIADMKAAAAWLTGSGWIIFGNDTTVQYSARVDEEITFDRINPGQEIYKFTVSMICDPYRYLAPAAANIELTVSGGTVSNAYTAASLPVIKIEGSGDVTFSVGTQVIELTGLVDGIIMDSEMQDAYDLAATELMNESMTGEFPELDVGNNVISWTGTVTKVTITPRWRSL